MESPTNYHTLTYRLEALANLPEHYYGNVRLHGDLSLHNKAIKEQLPLIGSFFSTAAPHFDQVAEFFKALENLQNEIANDDFALLKDENARQFLPRALNTLKKIGYKWTPLHEHCRTDEKIVAIRTIVFSHMPLQMRNGLPQLNSNFYKSLFEKDDMINCIDFFVPQPSLLEQYSKSMEAIVEEIESLPALSTNEYCLDLFRRFIAFRHESSSKPEWVKKISSSIDQLTFLLFEHGTLAGNQYNFLEQVFKTNFNDQYIFQGSRSNEFKKFLHDRIDSCLKSYDSPVEILLQFEHICTVANRFAHFMENKKESLFDPVRPRSKNEDYDQRGLVFHEQRRELAELFLPVLRFHINDEVVKFKLKDILLYQDPVGPASYLADVIRDYHRTDSSTLLYDNHPVNLKMDILYRSGFLVPEGEFLRISDEWIKVIEALIPNPHAFLNEAFGPLKRLPEKDPRHIYYKRFLKGSGPLRYPNYFIQHAFADDAGISAYLMKKMARLTPIQSRAFVFPEIDVDMHEKYLQLYLAAEEASNNYFMEFSLRALREALIEFFSINRSSPLILNVPERVFIQLVNQLSPKDLSKIYPGNVDLKRLPCLTCAGLSALLKRIPDLNVFNFDYNKPTPLSDLIFEHGDSLLYVNSAIIKRSSGYFEGLLAPHFKEGMLRTNTVALPFGHFQFFKKWIEVIFQPGDNFYKRNMTDYPELFLRLKSTPANYVLELFLAQTYLMPHLFDLIDKIYTLLIVPVKNDESAALVREEVEKFKKAAKKDATTRNLLLQLKETQFVMALGLD